MGVAPANFGVGLGLRLAPSSSSASASVDFFLFSHPFLIHLDLDLSFIISLLPPLSSINLILPFVYLWLDTYTPTHLHNLLLI